MVKSKNAKINDLYYLIYDSAPPGEEKDIRVVLVKLKKVWKFSGKSQPIVKRVKQIIPDRELGKREKGLNTLYWKQLYHLKDMKYAVLKLTFKER